MKRTNLQRAVTGGLRVLSAVHISQRGVTDKDKSRFDSRQREGVLRSPQNLDGIWDPPHRMEVAGFA
jgi:hypothetical protein